MGADGSLAGAIGEAEADRLLAPLAAANGVGLAVSGGADSTALMRLVAGWRDRTRPDLPLFVFTVDHGLRSGSADEAARVAASAAALGLPHETLAWEGGASRDLQAAARRARYRLLADACARHGLTHLATAHHRDDQAETFLLRLARGSGVDGLAAMPPQARRGRVVHLRPLLDVPKARLEATLRHAGESWIDDPSNAEPRFARARLRALMPDLAREGLGPARLAATARRMASARRVLETAARDLEDRCVAFHPAGCAILEPGPLRAGEEELSLRVLSRLVRSVGGGDYPPRLHRLERLMEDVTAAGFAGATLGGCDLFPWRGGVLCCRERGREGLPGIVVAPGRTGLWDGRFLVENSRPGPVHVAAAGSREALPSTWDLPARALGGVPAAFDGSVAVAVPGATAGENNGVTLRFLPLDARGGVASW